jgi:hypothetical protein
MRNDYPNPKRQRGTTLPGPNPRLRVLKLRYFTKNQAAALYSAGSAAGEQMFEFGDAARSF